MARVQDFAASLIDGEGVSLDRWYGQVLLIVNTASGCGFTPQYEGLERLHTAYRDRGFAILGFPCNQFGGQEPGSETEIAGFCETRYQIDFPMFAKVAVNGDAAHPLFRYLAGAARGFLGSKRIKWNFTKFLIDREGRPVRRYAPVTPPERIAPAIDRLLG